MKINRLVLTNYGPYAGQNEFDLRTTEENPIILFGGKNGSGKTTLFNAIQICLHGRSAFDSRLSRNEYEDRMQSLLHESSGEKATTASIRLEFEYADFGETEHYAVERKFRDREKSLAETVTVRRDGKKLSDLEEDQWEDFLKELIPPGISQLFFFDGEKVESLASAIGDDEEFTDSLMSLLGLDLVDRLETDLTIYRSQKLDEEGHEELAATIEDVRERKQAAEEEQDELKSEIKEKEARIQELEKQIERKEQALAEEGGTFAERREEYKEERTKLETQIEEIRDDIRDLVTDCYPFALAPDLCREVLDRLEKETEAAQLKAARSEAVEALDDVATDDSVWSGLDISEESSDEIVAELQDALSDRLAPKEDAGYELAAEFSDREQQEMRAVVDEALNDIPTEMQALTEELEEKTRRQQEVEKKISNAPNQSVIEPLLGKINDLNSEKGELERDVESCKERLEEVEHNLGRLESELENKLEKQDELEDVSDRSELAADVRSTVQAYQDRLVEEKLERLESVLTDRYLQLSNKEDFYDGVVIDEEDISIQIRTTHGSLKHQSQLSAGERQIFATALLWALADISGRPLPFIIDTPLGRLDQEHRGKLVENFFPTAAHQVFLFSTDTEITEEYREALQDDIAAEFHLSNSQDTGQTSVSPGYFDVSATDAAQETDRVHVDHDHDSEKQMNIEGFGDD
ncbi:DNA sulfur modification protein DndD [Halomicrococcus sp. NG-SE-24]|uniref:DNA sulfur modification protein DndD n=1 Tax=Halomicrococcus sp. NG-SE-24 TaxID=3436928 RepID=UPI003D971C21